MHHFPFVVGCIALPLLGCAAPRVPVHGRVTLGGQPVEMGEVRFVPIDVARGGPARARPFAALVNSEYRLTTLGGLREGTYRVEVEVRHKTGRKAVVNVGFERVVGDETELVSPALYAGEQSPLRYVVPGMADRFDIDLPKPSAEMSSNDS